MTFIKGIEIEGLGSMEREFRKFNFKVPNIKSRFLDVIGEESLNLLKINTPRDTGNLADSWQMQKSTHEVVITNDQQDLISFITFGTIRHLPNPFIMVINQQVDNMVMKRLQQALAENHRWFKSLPGGKGRKFQQVGRTSAGFKGGTSFAGRATLVRVGTGRRQLKRRLSLRRRRGKSVNPSRKDVKLG
jgi:hypothetical protein